MQQLIDNLAVGGGVNTITTVGNPLNEVKLYGTIAEAFAQNGNFRWFSLVDIAALNNVDARPAGINSHLLNGQCVISLITYKQNGNQHNDYTLADQMEIR